MSRNTTIYALVKWLSGEDKNKFTAGVPTDWIRDFKCKNFKNDGYPSDHSFIAEWRVGKKPAGGWPVYDVLVVEISEKVPILEKKIQTMSLSRSPKQVASSSGSLRSSPRKSSQAKSSLFNVGKKSASQSPVKKKVQATLFDQPKAQDKKEKSSQKAASFAREMSGLDVLPPETAAPPLMTFSPSDFNDFKLDLLNEVKGCLTPLSERLGKVEEAIADRPSQPQTTSDSTKGSASVAASGETEKVRIGAGLHVAEMQKQAYDSALASPTPSSMTKSLLVASFPLKVLLQSTYKGGKTKVGDNKGRASKALDANILAALRECVTKKYPNFTGAQFGMAINQKLTSLKSKYKESAELASDKTRMEDEKPQDPDEDEENPQSSSEAPEDKDLAALEDKDFSDAEIHAHQLSDSESDGNE